MQPLVSLEISEFVDSSGRSPFRHWFDGLDAVVAARVTAALARLALGSWSNVKSVGEGVQELRLDIGPGYRVYFGVHERRVVILLGGGTKRRQQADIERARRIWRQLRPRNEIGGVRWH
jgi:putative addiction module killer protein